MGFLLFQRVFSCAPKCVCYLKDGKLGEEPGKLRKNSKNQMSWLMVRTVPGCGGKLCIQCLFGVEKQEQ